MTEMKLELTNQDPFLDKMAENLRLSMDREIAKMFRVPEDILNGHRMVFDTDPTSWKASLDEKLPICDVCNKKVESLVYTKCDRDSTMKIVARCHGKVEAVSIPQEVFYSVGLDDDIEFDHAFKKQKKLNV